MGYLRGKSEGLMGRRLLRKNFEITRNGAHVTSKKRVPKDRTERVKRYRRKSGTCVKVSEGLKTRPRV